MPYKKIAVLALFTLSLSLFFGTAIHAITYNNKTTAQGLGNNTVNSVYVSGTTIYAATSEGLSISTDGGNTFINKTTANGLGNNNVKDVYVSGTNVYVGTSGGLSISTDGGNTFTNKTTANGLGDNNAQAIYVSQGKIYVGTFNGLGISTDGGNTFTNKTTANGLGDNNAQAIYVSDGTIYVGTFSGLGISTDGGNTFTNKTTANGLGYNIVYGIYVTGTNVYVATGGGLSISTDGGNSFINKTTADGLANNFPQGVYVSGATIYAATSSGLSVSTNGGNTFTTETTVNGLGSNVVNKVFVNGDDVYVATDGGLSIYAAPPTPTATPTSTSTSTTTPTSTSTATSTSIPTATPTLIPTVTDTLSSSVFIIGKVVQPDGTAFSNSGGGPRTDAVVYWWDTNRQWSSSAPLSADGSFNIPVSDSVYEISLWIDPKLYPNLAVPTPFYREINGNTVNVGTLQLIQGQATIQGKVSVKDTSQSLQDVTVDVWGSHEWFTAQTDDQGNYNITVPFGTWQVIPHYAADSPSHDLYLFTQTPTIVEVTNLSSEVVADFEATQIATWATVNFVENGAVVSITGSVDLVTADKGDVLSTAYPKAGSFKLPLPTDCIGCELLVMAHLAPGSAYSLVTGPALGLAADNFVTFTVQANTATFKGQFLAENGSPITDLTGATLALIPLGDEAAKVTEQLTSVDNLGRFEFTQVGAGNFSLDYQAVISDEYRTQSGQGLTVTLTANQATTQDITLIPYRQLTVTVATADGVTLPKPEYYPMVARCAATSAELETTPFLACEFRETEQGLVNLCPVVFDPQTNCEYAFADASVNNVITASFRGDLQAMGRGGNTNPAGRPRRPRQQGDLTFQTRLLNQLFQGQILGADGQPKSEVQVAISPEGNDGQSFITWTDTQGNYQFQVSKTTVAWNITAMTEQAGFYYQTTPLTVRNAVSDTITLAPLTLIKGDPRIVPKHQTFPYNQATSFAFDRAVVNVPAGAMPLQQGEAVIDMAVVQKPNTGFYQVVGRSYRLKFFEQATELELTPLRRSVVVSFGYDAAELTKLNLTPNQLRVAYFAKANKQWITLPGGTLDVKNQRVNINLMKGWDTLALVGPSPVTSSTQQQLYLPLIIKP